MNKESLRTFKRLSTMLLFFSITSLILISFVPWITVGTGDGGKNVKYLDYEMMKKSDDENIMELTEILSLLTYFLWGIILIDFVSLFGLVLYTAKKYLAIANILIFAGFFIFVMYIVVLIYNLTLFNNINNAEGISIATVLGGIGYSHILFIFNLLPFIISIFYLINSVSLLGEYISDKKKDKEKSKKITKKSKREMNEREDSNTLVNKKVMKAEDWNKKSEPNEEILIETETDEDKIKDDTNLELKQVEKSYFENKTVDLDKKHGIEPQKNAPKKEIEEEPVPEEKEAFKETEDAENEEVYERPSDKKLDRNFEKALLSAIEKRKKQQDGEIDLIKNVKDEEKDKKGNFERGTYTIRCARCGHIFTTEIKSKSDKIKCPKCGKEGPIK